jgi:hypothetical protein
VTSLGWVLIGVFVFVVVGAVGALKFGDWLDRRQKRKAQRAQAEAEPEVW